jgi:hypothetical protein
MTVVMAPAVAAFWIRYGHPAVSDWGSIALYAHVVHLTDLEDPDYPELTRELKPIVEPLSALSLGGRRYVGDWAIFGTVPEWAPDDISIPRSTWDIITEHARKDRSSEPLLTRTSRIYGALARRAIITHPGGYIAHATRSFVRMWAEGMGVRYPHPDVTVERHSLSVAHWAAAYRELGRPTPPLRGAYRSDYQLGSAMYAAGRAFRWLTTRTTWLLHRFGGFAWVPIAVWTFAVVSWPRARQTTRDSLVAVGVCTVVTVFWMAIHALVLVSESLRLMVPVQDAVALVPVAATHGVIAILWKQRRQAV